MDISAKTVSASDVAAWLALLVPLVAFCWAMYRTGSINPLHWRLGKLVFGEPSVGSERIQKMWQERKDLAIFKYETSLRKVSCIEVAEEVCRAAKHHRIDAAKLGFVGGDFNAESLTLKYRGCKKHLGWYFICMAVPFSAALAASKYSLSEAASKELLLTVRATGNYFWVNTEGAGPKKWFTSEEVLKPSLTAENCNRPRDVLAEQTNLDKEDVDVMCGVLSEKYFDSFFERMLGTQRRLLLVFAITLFGVSLIPALAFLKRHASYKLSNHLLTWKGNFLIELKPIPAERDVSAPR